MAGPKNDGEPTAEREDRTHDRTEERNGETESPNENDDQTEREAAEKEPRKCGSFVVGRTSGPAVRARRLGRHRNVANVAGGQSTEVARFGCGVSLSATTASASETDTPVLRRRARGAAPGHPDWSSVLPPRTGSIARRKASIRFTRDGGKWAMCSTRQRRSAPRSARRR